MSSNPSLEIDSGIQQEKKDHLNEPSLYADDDGTPQNFYCLITGANSGLGLALCCRFLAHFLLTRPPKHHLTLIFTTRSQTKSLQTTQNILGSLHKSFSSSSSTSSKTSRLPSERFTLAPEFVDLTDLQSVYSLSSRLRRSYKKIDWIYCNAGLLTTVGGGGVDYVRGVWAFLTRPIEAATLPDFKLQNKGEVVIQGEKPRGGQIAKVKSVGGKNKKDEKGTVDEKDGLGVIFCANVFGHYCLVRGVLGLLSRGGIRKGERARVIWTSSLDAFSRSLDPQDIQCIRGEEPYESSKRLTDILALTWPEYGFTDLDKSRGPRTTNIDKTRLPKFIVTHPAICATNIAGQHPIVWYVMLGVFYLVRILCGSPWLPITAWKGNSANMRVAEESEEALDKKGKHKWGSGCGRFGNELLMMTEIEGVSEEGVVSEEFKETGKECWRRMEEFRRVWEGKLGLSCD